MSKVAVVFWSSSGNTETMAEAVLEGAKGAGAEAGHLQIQATEENAGCLYCGNENCSESLYSRHRTKAVKAVQKDVS